MKNFLFCLLLISCIPFASAQLSPAPRANYAMAAKFSPKKLEKLVFSTAVDPHWMRKGDKFWYMYESGEGKKWYIVDPAKGLRQPMFDNEKLAAALTRIVKDPFDAQHLDIDSLQFVKEETVIRFQVKSSLEIEKKDTARKAGTAEKEKKVFYFEYDLQSGNLVELTDFTRPKRKPSWASVSPDKKWVVFTRNYNLYRMDSLNYAKALAKEDDSTIAETALTTDGMQHYSWGGEVFGETDIEREKNNKKRRPASVVWSPDSRYFTIIRSDNRAVKDLWVLHNVAEGRPALETYKYHMPGEKEAPRRELFLFPITGNSYKKINSAAFKDQEIAVSIKPQLKRDRDEEDRSLTWLGAENHFYVTRTSRDLKRIDICIAEVDADSLRPLIEERMNTYLETRRLGLVNNGKELVHWSERDGWGHFYLYDGDGKLRNQITSGSYHCEELIGIDEKNRVIYFTANGREPGEDPYFLHLYRVNFDGSGLKLLNPGDYDHQVSMDDNNKYFINNFSRVNTSPVSVLLDATGKKVMDLEITELNRLFESGYRFPQPFKVKADDGITDLYGVMYKPYDFDSTKKYPIIAYVYPGPQTEAVNKAFSKSMDRTDRLAQLGFIVITIGNRGGHPSRSKWYHNYGYGNLRDYGLADKKAAIEQLVLRHPFIDADRVGIHGHSGGGFMSTAALLVYPDFFKVAVSSAGNHENNIYNRWWSEKHHGVRELVNEKNDTSFVYAIEKNSELAKNLKGRLLLATGDVDNNVHPANTIRVAQALIKANKRFDFVLLPGQRHGFGDMTEYFFWVMADHFSKWLLGDFSQPLDMIEMNREVEQNGGKKKR